MSNKLIVAMALSISLAAPAAAQAPATGPAEALSPLDVKAANARLEAIPREISVLRKRIGRLNAPQNREYDARGAGAAEDYRSMVITSTNGLAGISGQTTAPMAERIQAYQDQINALLKEQAALRARLSVRQAGA